jgi:hypothetical protein
MDWIFGFFIGRSPDVDVVEYGGEKIYHLRREGSAFFLRGSDFFFTTDLEAARRVVDRLQPGSGTSASEATRLDRMLGAMPAEYPLRGATTNEHGEVRRLIELVGMVEEREILDGLDWEDVGGMSLFGGFTTDSSFEATLELVFGGRRWTEQEAETLAGVLRSSLDSDKLPVETRVEARPDRVQLVFHVEDLPGLLRHRIALDE